MPQINIRWYRSVLLDDRQISDVANDMPELVVQHLPVEEVFRARFNPREIEVFVDEGNLRTDVLGSALDFTVRIEAMYSPERMQRVQEAADKILEELHERFRNLRFNVWIVLSIAGFAETP